MIKVSLDLDDTIFEWNNHYISRFGNPKDDYEITKNVMGILRKDKNFWLSQPIINIPNFVPTCYCTSRVIPKSWIKEQIKKSFLPNVPIYQVFGVSLSKVPQLRKANINVHVDDNLHTFIDCNLRGIPCLLLDSPKNQSWNEAVGRVYSLDKEEIEETYYLFIKTIFPYFKEIIK